jgi:hypothetical protein
MVSFRGEVRGQVQAAAGKFSTRIDQAEVAELGHD